MKTLLTLLILLLGFRTAGAQSSVILDKVISVREVVRGSSRELYSDLIQYRYYQNGTLTQTQRINGATYHFNGGGYGSAATRTFYSNMVSFLR